MESNSKLRAKEAEKEYRRMSRSFSFFRFLLKYPVCRFFRFSYDPLPDIPGPFLLVSNHTTEFDPIFLSIAAGKPLRFVANEHIMRKGFGTRFLTAFFHPIVHRKGRDGLRSAAEILRSLRRGENVMLFPEGNRTFNGVTMELMPATAKLAVKSGAALVTYRLKGGFLTQPRFSTSIRRGFVRAELVRIYTPEELSEMSGEAVASAMEEDLYEDAYRTQETEPQEFSGKRLAEGLESTIFSCPVCGGFRCLNGKDRILSCGCGFLAEYRKDGLLHAGEQSFTLYELDRLQREALLRKSENAGDAEALFRDPVSVRYISEDHSVRKEEWLNLSGAKDGLTIGDRHFPWKEVRSLSVYSRNSVTLFLGDSWEHLDIHGDTGFNALGYLYLYQMQNKTTGE